MSFPLSCECLPWHCQGSNVPGFWSNGCAFMLFTNASWCFLKLFVYHSTNSPSITTGGRKVRSLLAPTHHPTYPWWFPSGPGTDTPEKYSPLAKGGCFHPCTDATGIPWWLGDHYKQYSLVSLHLGKGHDKSALDVKHASIPSTEACLTTSTVYPNKDPQVFHVSCGLDSLVYIPKSFSSGWITVAWRSSSDADGECSSWSHCMPLLPSHMIWARQVLPSCEENFQKQIYNSNVLLYTLACHHWKDRLLAIMVYNLPDKWHLVPISWHTAYSGMM